MLVVEAELVRTRENQTEALRGTILRLAVAAVLSEKSNKSLNDLLGKLNSQ